MEIRVVHALSTDELARRIRAEADRHDVGLTEREEGRRGELVKDAGFLGTVRAEYAIEVRELVVVVRERPAFLPEGSLRRTLEEALAKLVAP